MFNKILHRKLSIVHPDVTHNNTVPITNQWLQVTYQPHRWHGCDRASLEWHGCDRASLEWHGGYRARLEWHGGYRASLEWHGGYRASLECGRLWFGAC
jgi:hypothetical protein